MGKESKKRVDICICITDSLCCTPETNTTLKINYTPIKRKKFVVIKGLLVKADSHYSKCHYKKFYKDSP